MVATLAIDCPPTGVYGDRVPLLPVLPAPAVGVSADGLRCGVVGGLKPGWGTELAPPRRAPRDRTGGSPAGGVDKPGPLRHPLVVPIRVRRSRAAAASAWSEDTELEDLKDSAVSPLLLCLCLVLGSVAGDSTPALRLFGVNSAAVVREMPGRNAVAEAEGVRLAICSGGTAGVHALPGRLPGVLPTLLPPTTFVPGF